MTPSQLVLSLDAPAIGQTRRNDCQSSVDAAAMVDAQRQRDVFARELASAPLGLTADEIEERTGVKREHVASRLKQMERWGQTYSQGKRQNLNGIKVKLWFVQARACSVQTVKVTGNRL